MAKLVDRVQDGKNEIVVAWQPSGFSGPHWTMWGRGMCLHIYEDDCSIPDVKILAMAKTLEETTELGVFNEESEEEKGE